MRAAGAAGAALALVLLAAPAPAEVTTRSWTPRTEAGEQALRRAVVGASARDAVRAGGTAAGWARANAAALRDPSADWAYVRQAGTGLDATVTQAGGGNVAAVIQVGRGAAASVAQAGGEAGLVVQWGQP